MFTPCTRYKYNSLYCCHTWVNTCPRFRPINVIPCWPNCIFIYSIEQSSKLLKNLPVFCHSLWKWLRTYSEHKIETKLNHCPFYYKHWYVHKLFFWKKIRWFVFILIGSLSLSIYLCKTWLHIYSKLIKTFLWRQ